MAVSVFVSGSIRHHNKQRKICFSHFRFVALSFAKWFRIKRNELHKNMLKIEIQKPSSLFLWAHVIIINGLITEVNEKWVKFYLVLSLDSAWARKIMPEMLKYDEYLWCFWFDYAQKWCNLHGLKQRQPWLSCNSSFVSGLCQVIPFKISTKNR